jgi:hypothetical protein
MQTSCLFPASVQIYSVSDDRQQHPIFTMVFVLFTMVFAASTMVFVVVTKVFVFSTLIFGVEKMLSILDHLSQKRAPEDAMRVFNHGQRVMLFVSAESLSWWADRRNNCVIIYSSSVDFRFPGFCLFPRIYDLNSCTVEIVHIPCEEGHLLCQRCCCNE